MMWRKASLTPADSFIMLALTIGLLVSLFILMKPYPAGQVGLLPSVNVVATAQAMQTHRQQAELETAHQSQKATWAAELDKKHQELLKANRQGQAQIAPRQAQLSDLQSQINQTQANLQAMQQKITELQQAIQVDEAAYQNQLAALKADLEQVQTQPTPEPTSLSATYSTGAEPTIESLSAGHESASASPAPTPAAEGDKHNTEPESNSSSQHDNSSHSNQDSHPQADDNAED